MGDFDFGAAFGDFGGSPSDFIGSADTGYGGGGGGYSGLADILRGDGGSSPWFSGLTADPSGGGSGDWLGTLSGYAKDALPFLKLGTQGLGAYTGIKGIQEAGQQQKYLHDAQQRAQQAAAPGIAAAGQLIPAGTQALMGGALPPQLEATVQSFVSGEKAKMRQQMAHMGITDSQAIVQAEAAIDAQAQALRAQLAQGLLSGGQGVLGAGIQGAQLEGNLARGEGDSVTAAITAANKAVEQLLGMAG